MISQGTNAKQSYPAELFRASKTAQDTRVFFKL
jgi:hypothetical protein